MSPRSHPEDDVSRARLRHPLGYNIVPLPLPPNRMLATLALGESEKERRQHAYTLKAPVGLSSLAHPPIKRIHTALHAYVSVLSRERANKSATCVVPRSFCARVRGRGGTRLDEGESNAESERANIEFRREPSHFHGYCTLESE